MTIVTTPPVTFKAPSFIIPPSGDTTGVTDLSNINTAITSLSAGSIELTTGTYYINGPISITGSNIYLYGQGIGKTIIKFAANSAIPTTGMYNAPSYNQVGNDLSDITFDCNQQSGVTALGNFLNGIVNPGSSCLVQRIEIVNKPVGPVGIAFYSRDLTIRDCWLHDDPMNQSVTTGALINGAGVVIPVSSTTGAAVNGFVVIDPAVTIQLTQAVTLSASPQAVSVAGYRPHTMTNGGVHNDLLGLYVGQVVAFDVGGSAENVALTAVNAVAGTVSGIFTKNHASGALASYTPNATQAPLNVSATETAVITAVNPGVSITATIQQNHSSGVAVVYLAPVADGISCAPANSGQPCYGIKIENNRLWRLGQDAMGLTGHDIEVFGNTIFQCGYGIVATNGSNYLDVIGNDIDLLWTGIYPNPISSASNIYCPISWKYLSTVNSGTWYDWTVSDNSLRGGVYGIQIVPTNNNSLNNVVVSNNSIDNPMLGGIFAGSSKGLNIQNNSIRNANAANYNTINNAGTSLQVAGIIVSATTAGSPVDTAFINGNTVYDDRGSHLMQCYVVAFGQFLTNSIVIGNAFSGQSGAVGIQVNNPTAANQIVVRQSNAGYNVGASFDTSTAAVSLPTMANGNGKPTASTNYVNVSGRDLELYITTAGGAGTSPTIDGVAIGAPNTVGMRITWKSGSTFNAGAWTVTQPVYQAYGS